MSEIETPWVIKGREFLHCSCAPGNPCHFNGRVSQHPCHAVAGLRIDDGQYGSTDISGLAIAMVLARGNGAEGMVQPFVDRKADKRQAEALIRIMVGLDAVPGSTFFQTFSSAFQVIQEPVFADVDLEVDFDGRHARLVVPGYIDARAEPVVDPATNEPRRLRMTRPELSGYEMGEIGRGWSTVTGPIAFEISDRHAQFVPLVMTERGVLPLPL